ncbi:MAG TPA: hypothetical protein PKA58_15320 [Polyangium sp.]|nr:hypothetical protein [Polyangium sp.]
MGTFERRTTPPPPATTTERTSWIPPSPERQSWTPPAPVERQSWPPPAPSERSSFTPPPPPTPDKPTFSLPQTTDRAGLALLAAERLSPPPGSESRSSMRAVRTSPTSRSSMIPVVSDRTAPVTQERQWYTELPLRPGEGPFQVKGVAHRGLLHYCQQRIDGGIRAFAAALPNHALRDFFEQPFLAGSFYDMLPLAAGSAVAAELTRTPLETFGQQQGRAQAVHDVKHAYRALLQGRTADDFHLRLRPLASRYYNFGEWDVLRHEPYRLRVTGRGIPSWLMAWFTPMLSGYFAGLVAAMGKPHSQVVVASARREGTAAGLSLSNLDLDILLRD